MNEPILEEALNSLGTGSAICFLGAGFAADATDQTGKNIPTTEQLASEICDLIGIARADRGSLADLADYCQNDIDLAPKLKTLLINRLTHCNPTEGQRKILRAPWRSIFTTNFDDIVERALSTSAPRIITSGTDVKLIVGDNQQRAEKIYPLRSAEYILRLVEEKIDFMESDLKQRLQSVLAAMQRIVSTEKLERAQKGEAEKLAKTIARAILVLKNA